MTVPYLPGKPPQRPVGPLVARHHQALPARARRRISEVVHRTVPFQSGNALLSVGSSAGSPSTVSNLKRTLPSDLPSFSLEPDGKPSRSQAQGSHIVAPVNRRIGLGVPRSWPQIVGALALLTGILGAVAGIASIALDEVIGSDTGANLILLSLLCALIAIPIGLAGARWTRR